MPPVNLIGLVIAAAVSAAALFAVRGTDSHAADYWVSPYVVPGVILFHTITALPLTAALSAAARPARWAAGPWAVLVIVVVGLTVVSGHVVADVLESYDAGPVCRSAVRVLWCLALQFPCCASVVAWRGADGGATARQAVLAVVVAVAVPSAYVVHVAEVWAGELRDAVQQQRLMKAARLAERLYQTGCEAIPEAITDSSTVSKADLPTVKQLRSDLWVTVRELEELISRPLPADAGADAITSRGGQLAQLDRLTEAETTLRSVSTRFPPARLPLAAVLQARQSYAESSELYRQVIDENRPLLRVNADRLPLAVAAVGGVPVGGSSAFATRRAIVRAADSVRRGYDGLAFNARRGRAFDESVGYYEEAMTVLPEARAYFHFRLGLTWAEAGHPGRAGGHFLQAAALDPRRFGDSAAAHLRRLRRDTPGCLIPAQETPSSKAKGGTPLDLGG